MISLETAKKLREAGSQWEPREGDWYYHADKWGKILSPQPFLVDSRVLKHGKIGLSDIFAPRLDQLLIEIEQYGYKWDIGNLGSFRDDDVCIGLFNNETRECVMQFFGDTPEETATQALLWILEREKGGTAG